MNFIQAAAPAVGLSNLGGSGAVYVAGDYTGLNYWLVGTSEMKSPEELKGEIIGVSGLTGASFTATQFAIRKVGLDPSKDISVVAIGGTPEPLVVLHTGRIHATLLNPPTVFWQKERGLEF